MWIDARSGLMLLVVSGSSVVLAAESLVFDSAVLRDRGIDPALAAYFRDAPRFTHGEHVVVLEVNGASRGRVRMTFNGQGEPCLASEWLKVAGVQPPPAAAAPQIETCLTIAQGFPTARVQLHPGREQVDLLVPTETLITQDRPLNNFANGGVAGLLNYDALIVGSESAGQRNTFRSLGSEVGLNAGNWILRSRQSYTAMAESTRFEHLYAYGMRTLEDEETSLQVGQLNLASPLFAGDSFTGVQLLPERAFTQLRNAQKGASGQVEGVAYSAARIEVRQNGVLIFTTMVPGGPFTLRALPLLSQQLDVEVSVHEEDGQVRHFRVPAASLQEGRFDVPGGFNFALGTVRRLGTNERQAPSFTTFSKDWDWGRASRLTGGLLAGPDYLSAGWGLQRQWSGDLLLNAQQVVAEERSRGLTGNQLQLSLSARFSPTLSTNVVAVRQSQDFRTLSDSGRNRHEPDTSSRHRDHVALSLQGSTEHSGVFGTTWSRYSSAGTSPQNRMSLSWSQTFPERISVSLSLERNIAGAEADRQRNAAYLTVGVPLGGQRRLRSYVRHDERSALRSGVAVSDVLSETLAYSAGAEYRDGASSDVSARLNALPHYTSVDLGVGQRSGATQYDVGLRGGVAVHRDGVTLSPYPLSDTFGVLKAGERAGVKLYTPQGPVWTDGLGRAVAASLPAYSTSRLEVDPLSLPIDTEVLNGLQEVDAGRGSVQHLDFSLIAVRRLLLKVRTPDRQWLPKGLPVEDEQRQYVTSVLETGTIFLPDVKPGQNLQVQLPDATRCHLQFVIPEPHADSPRIEQADAVCVPVDLS